jgi:hypothetical protein
MSFISKNDLAVELIQTFPASREEQVYVLMEADTQARKLVDACNAKGFHAIGAIKSNRKIRPNRIEVSMSTFASQYIQKSDLRSVTVKEKGNFRICENEGPVSEIENAKEIQTGPEPVCLPCTDLTLDVVTILEY